MRPTIAEQLRETRRILTDIVAPQINAYSKEILRMALSNLEMLERAWEKVPKFLYWDNSSTLALLRNLQDQVPADLASAIVEAGHAPPDDPLDISTLEIRNAALRALLHQAVGQCGDEGWRAIQAQLLERTARYPMRPLRAAPAGPGETRED